MDAYISFTVFLLISIQLSNAVSLSSNDRHLLKDGCRQCKPGYYAERNCTDLHDTICAPCRVQHFTEHHNRFQQCFPCSVCGKGLFEISQCTPTSDVLCRSCDDTQALDNPDYKIACLVELNQNTVDNSINDTKIDVSYIELGSGELPFASSEVTFGKDALLSKSGFEVEYAIPSDNATDFKLNNETDEDGSGDIDVFIVDFSTSPTNISSSKFNPDLIEDELLPVTSAELPDKNTTTTATTPVMTKSTIPLEVNYHAIPATAASRKEAGESDTVTVGVVIAVGIVAAIVFFVLGFLASRYCRRRRQSFQIMKKVGKNGKPASFGSTDKVKYVEPGIYDEIGKGPNGKYAPTRTPPPEDDLYAVPLKKSSAPKTNRAPSFDNIEGIKYIDETTDDETDLSPKDQLLTKTKDKDVKEKMNGTTPRNSANLSPIGEEKQPMLLKSDSVAV